MSVAEGTTEQPTDRGVRLSRLDSVEFARGLAALAVCLFHFTKYLWPDDSGIRKVGSFGWAGVESFFVISGFILPYAMERSGYRLASFPRFVAKRYVRLVPPYLAAVMLALMLWAVSACVPGFRGEPFRFETSRLFAHIFFLNDFVGIPWLNPVFWTLAIEFQYYLAIGLLFPLLFSGSQIQNIVAVIALGVVTWLPGPDSLVSKWSLVFLVGIVLAQWRLARMGTVAACLLECLVLSSIWQHHGRVIFAASFLTLGFILAVRHVPCWGLWLGQLSYTVYLVHVPVGGRIVNLSARWIETESQRWLALLLALTVSYVTACLFHIAVERPALTIAARIRYSGKSLHGTDIARV